MVEPAYLIVASSGRALAASAQRAGIPVQVVDLFADQDTRRYAESVYVAGTTARGFAPARLLDLVRRLRHEGVIVGSGLEGQEALLKSLEEACRIFGNPAPVVQRVKDPACFFRQLDRLGIPHPETLEPGVANSEGWLMKRIGAAGGAHIRALKAGERCPQGFYLQRYVEGRPHSVVFLANGKHARIIGYNEIWPILGFAQTPFKYGGAVTLPAIDKRLARHVAEVVEAVVAAFELRGLCGLDLIVDTDNRFYVLEVNPRPPATFELHEGGVSLFEQHLKACCGSLRGGGREAQIRSARAHAILYAARPIEISEELVWPEWTTDRPAPGTPVGRGAPVCTVHACASDPELARRLVMERLRRIEAEVLWQEEACLINSPLPRRGRARVGEFSPPSPPSPIKREGVVLQIVIHQMQKETR